MGKRIPNLKEILEGLLHLIHGIGETSILITKELDLPPGFTALGSYENHPLFGHFSPDSQGERKFRPLGYGRTTGNFKKDRLRGIG